MRELQRIAREEKLAYVEAQQREAEERSAELTARIEELELLLRTSLDCHHKLDFGSLKQTYTPPEFDAHGLETPPSEPVLALPPNPNFLARSIPFLKQRYERMVNEAIRQFSEEKTAYAALLAERAKQLEGLKAQYESECTKLAADVEAANREIDAFRNDYENRVPAAVNQYFELVLDDDQLPDGFPTENRVAYIIESVQLVVERRLPIVDTIPKVLSYKYVKASDRIETKPRPTSQIRTLYNALVAQMALSTVNTIFSADDRKTVDVLVLNCFVDTIDPATGKQIQPCLLSLRITRDAYSALDLARVDPVICLRSLGARVSASPHELTPVQPVVNFNMVDPRFIDEQDVLDELEQRPNLAELTPGEFESLMTNLFEKMGLETRLTRPSRDGGVDCVAWDQREILGGKVVIQAKRYRNTVGVSAVRDLFGTMINEGASKGILVTTSGYGKATYDFAQNKPIELLTGQNLVYLLDHYANVRAKIDFPETWTDPSPDTPESGFQSEPAVAPKVNEDDVQAIRDVAEPMAPSTVTSDEPE